MKPLSKKIRATSLVLMFLIFLVVGPILLIGALGYKLDQLEDVFTIVKTGGIYLQSDISGIKVYVDGNFVKKNGLFLRNTLVEELKPNETHELVVRKEGFYSWTKKLTVHESLVTEVRLMMLPENIDDREIYPYLDLEGNGLTEEPLEGEFLINKEHVELLKLFTPEEEVEEVKDIFDTKSLEDVVITSAKNIPEYFINLGVDDPDKLENLITMGGEVSWLDNGNVLIHWIGRETAAPCYYCLSPEECRTKITLDWEDDINSFDFFPGRSDVLIVSVDSGIYAVEIDDRSERNIQPIYFGDDLEWIKTENDRIVVKDGNIFHELHF